MTEHCLEERKEINHCSTTDILLSVFLGDVIQTCCLLCTQLLLMSKNDRVVRIILNKIKALFICRLYRLLLLRCTQVLLLTLIIQLNASISEPLAVVYS